MRTLLYSFLLLVPMMILNSCGSSLSTDALIDETSQTLSCPGDHNGTWMGSTVADQIILADSCNFNYSGHEGCESGGTYATPNAITSTVQITVQTASGNCMPPGEYTCAYVLTSNTLMLDCGNGAFSYQK